MIINHVYVVYIVYIDCSGKKHIYNLLYVVYVVYVDYVQENNMYTYNQVYVVYVVYADNVQENNTYAIMTSFSTTSDTDPCTYTICKYVLYSATRAVHKNWGLGSEKKCVGVI